MDIALLQEVQIGELEVEDKLNTWWKGGQWRINRKVAIWIKDGLGTIGRVG